MKEVAIAIRENLRKAGVPLRNVSVRCKRSYTIIVKSLTLETDSNAVHEAAREAYCRRPHHWLCVCVDGRWLEMPGMGSGR